MSTAILPLVDDSVGGCQFEFRQDAPKVTRPARTRRHERGSKTVLHIGREHQNREVRLTPCRLNRDTDAHIGLAGRKPDIDNGYIECAVSASSKQCSSWAVATTSMDSLVSD